MTLLYPLPEGTPAERLVRDEAAVLTDAELLSVFLARRGGTTPLAQAETLLARAGSLRALLEDTCVDGGGCEPMLPAARRARLLAGREIAARVAYHAFEGREVLGSPDAVRRYLALRFAGLEHEIFAALFLDNRHRVIAFEELFRGTIDSAAVYPREVVKRCLAVNAAAVIFAHPHPSGVAEPSETDVRLTRKLVDALALVDVRVLDHLVVGRGEQVSLAERGLM